MAGNLSSGVKRGRRKVADVIEEIREITGGKVVYGEHGKPSVRMDTGGGRPVTIMWLGYKPSTFLPYTIRLSFMGLPFYWQYFTMREQMSLASAIHEVQRRILGVINTEFRIMSVSKISIV